MLACLAQACHPLVDPDTLRPALMAVVDRFVSDRSRPEVMAVGLNAVREICARTPLVMDATLLSDLLMYVKHRDKPVATAARSLLNLYRVLDPTLLHKTQRGREAAMAGAEPLRYGESTTVDGVENINLLARYREHGEQFPFIGDDVDGEAGEELADDQDDGSADASELSQEEGDDGEDDGISFDEDDDGNEAPADDDEDVDVDDNDDVDDDNDDGDDDGDDVNDDNDANDAQDDEHEPLAESDATTPPNKKRTSSAARLDAMRILSDRDYADLERAVEVARDAGSNAIKRKRMVEVEEEIGPLNAPIDKSVLEKGLKVAMSKEERQLKYGVRFDLRVFLFVCLLFVLSLSSNVCVLSHPFPSHSRKRNVRNDVPCMAWARVSRVVARRTSRKSTPRRVCSHAMVRVHDSNTTRRTRQRSVSATTRTVANIVKLLLLVLVERAAVVRSRASTQRDILSPGVAI